MESSKGVSLDLNEPLNDLEAQLFACMSGAVTREDFLNVFVNSNLFIMVDGEPVGDTLGDRQPLVVATAKDAPKLLAVFSDPQRAAKMTEMFVEYNYPIMVNAQWALQTLGPEMGIAFNPGCHFGFEIAPEGAQQLKAAVDQARENSAAE
jgi:hypothetical protein